MDDTVHLLRGCRVRTLSRYLSTRVIGVVERIDSEPVNPSIFDGEHALVRLDTGEVIYAATKTLRVIA